MVILRTLGSLYELTDKRSLIEASYNWLCFTACRLGIKMSTVIFELGFEIGIAADNQMENKDD